MSAAQRYRKKPVEIEAIRWTGGNFDQLEEWCGDHVACNEGSRPRLFIKANAVWIVLTVGEWVAKDRHGFYPIKDDVFLESYEGPIIDPGALYREYLDANNAT